MAAAVVVVWAVTAAVGTYLQAQWMGRGGLARQATRITVFPAGVVWAHPCLAVAGLGCWLGYLAAGDPVLAWCAFGLLCLATLLGFVMFTRWLTGRGGRHARGTEQGLPAAAVFLHGGAGLATFALALIVAELAARG